MAPDRRLPVAIVLAGASCIAASAILVRLSASSPDAAAFLRCAFAVPVLAALTRFDRRRPGREPMTARATWLARFSGLFLAGDLVLWSHAIAAVGAGLATVLGNLQVLVVALLAWAVLRERPDRSLVVALPIFLVGVMLVGGLAGSRTYGAHPAQGVAFGIGTSVFYAGYLLILRRSLAPQAGDAGTSGVGVIRPLFEATLGATVGTALLSLVFGDFHVGGWSGLGWLAILAVTSQVIGWLLIAVSLPKLPAALTSALLLVQPVGAVALGALVFGEHPSAEQVGGVGLILAGVVVATAGRPLLRSLLRSLLRTRRCASPHDAPASTGCSVP